MEKVKVTTFTKKGVEIEVQAAFGSMNEVVLYLVSPKAETHVLRTGYHEKYGWYYAVPNKFGEKTFGVKIPAGKQYIVLTDPSAKDATKKAKEILEKIEQEEAKKAFENLSDDAKITLIFATDFTTIVCENEAEKHDFFKTTKEKIHKYLNTDEIENTLGRKADEVDFGDYVHRFKYKMTFGEYKKLAELAEEKAKKAEVEKSEKEKAEKERIKKLFEKAKETGKPQVIEQYPVECNDPEEDCDIDIVTIYAMPDGTKKIERHHTW